MDEHRSEHRARELVRLIEGVELPVPMLMAGE
jgi:hypothetical protein